MSNSMPTEQAEFIDTLQKWFYESSNMCHEDCYRFAFVIWQHKDYLSKMLGYQQGEMDILFKLLSKNWWNPQQRIVMEEWLNRIKEQNK